MQSISVKLMFYRAFSVAAAHACLSLTAVAPSGLGSIVL